MNTIYTEAGYKNRRDYLTCLAEEHGLNPAVVYSLACVLGASEDFDGLVIACQDAEAMSEDGEG
jgi:hypothetical protein